MVMFFSLFFFYPKDYCVTALSLWIQRFANEDVVLRDAVNAALDEMILDGTLDNIFDKYDAFPNAYYRATVSYTNPYKGR